MLQSFGRCRARATRAVKAIALCVAAAGCGGQHLEMRQISHADYWGALAELSPDAAAGFARTPSQKLFAQSLSAMMSGDFAKAEAGFRTLQATADDSLLRAGARVAYSAVLQHEEKWSVLADVPPFVVANRDADRAEVQRWAGAFRNVPPKTLDFPSRVVIVPLVLSGVSTPLIPVRINGKDYHFWLDTGSSLTIVSSNVARSLGIAPLSADTLEMVTTTGRVAALPALIPRMDIGEIAVKNVAAMIVDDRLMEMREAHGADPGGMTGPARIDGIIGFDILRRLDIEIDYGEARLRLRDPAVRHNDDVSSRNLFWLGVPVVRLFASDGTPLHFGLDTGAQQTFGTESLFDKLEIRADRREARRVGGLAGIASLQAPIVHELKVTVRDHPLFLRELVIYAPVYRTLVSLDGVLGADVARAGVVRLDPTNGIFSVNEGLRKPENVH
jgi:hypothetical protein